MKILEPRIEQLIKHLSDPIYIESYTKNKWTPRQKASMAMKSFLFFDEQ
jgi:hypothetical protein